MIVGAIILVALVFDFVNGFHDAANSIATVVSTRVLSPRYAVIWAAFFNFVAFLFFGLHVANTIGKGIVDPAVVDPAVVFAALVGAIVWDLDHLVVYGIPSSSSHALIGGLAGAGRRESRRRHRSTPPGLTKITISIVLSPVIGLVLGLPLHGGGVLDLPALDPGAASTAGFAAASSCRRRSTASATAATTRRRRWASSPCCCSRPVTSATTFYVPLWVVLACHAAMALGTLSGGWRIVRTMGLQITKLKPVGGFCAETGGAITLFAATALGVPVSTTHTITGAIIGVGAVTKLSAIRWGVAGRIVWAWILTIPCSAFIAGLTWSLLQLA